MSYFGVADEVLQDFYELWSGGLEFLEMMERKPF
jgi:hypothetical protein